MDWRIRYDNYVEIYFNGKSPLKGIVLCQTVNPDITLGPDITPWILLFSLAARC